MLPPERWIWLISTSGSSMNCVPATASDTIRAATRRAPPRPRPRRSATRRLRRAGSTRPRRSAATTSPAGPRARRRGRTSPPLAARARRAACPPRATSAIRRPAASSKRPSGTRKIAPADARSAFGDGRVGAALGEGDRGAERVRGADQRADVARVGDVPERERDRPLLAGGRSARGRRRSPAAGARARDAGEELRLDVLAGDEQVVRLDSGREGGVDEILALADEEPGLRALPPALSCGSASGAGSPRR